MSKYTLHTSILLISLLSYSHVSANFQFTACNPIKDSQGNLTSPCEKVLVGAAHIDFDAIKWLNMNTEATITLAIVGGSSGFTGNSIYFGTTPVDTWIFRSTHEVKIINPVSHTSLNHFFAPLSENIESASESFTVIPPTAGIDQQISVRGIGIADNKKTPAITLDLQINKNETEGKNITISSCEDQVSCKKLGFPKNKKQSILLTLTPKVFQAHLPTGVQPVKYVMVNFKATKKNTSCLNFQLKLDERFTKNNWNERDKYFHYLDGSGPTASQGCEGTYPLLVSVDKEFKLRLTNEGNTVGDGYIQYDFYINGHYNYLAPKAEEYPGSHHSFRVSTATFSSPFTGYPEETQPEDTKEPPGTKPEDTQPEDTKEPPETKPEECPPATYNTSKPYSVQLPCVILSQEDGTKTQLSLDLNYNGTEDRPFYWWSLPLPPLDPKLNSPCQPKNEEKECVQLVRQNDNWTIPKVPSIFPVTEGKLNSSGQTVESIGFKGRPCSETDKNICWKVSGLNPPPILNFVVMQEDDQDYTISLDASLSRASTSGNTKLSYQWEITTPDKQEVKTTIIQGSLTDPSVTLSLSEPKPGTNNIAVKLTMTNGNGEESSLSQDIIVSPRPREAYYLLSLDPGAYYVEVVFPSQHHTGPYILNMEMLNETPISFITNSLWIDENEDWFKEEGEGPKYYTTFSLSSPQRVRFRSEFVGIYKQQQPSLFVKLLGKERYEIIYSCSEKQPCFNKE